MVVEINQNVFLIQIGALSFAKFEIFEFEISRVDCISFKVNLLSIHHKHKLTSKII